ncbi:DGQHR domain-containing protein [Levilactobacillus fuyuanensis]|uniref:DGQHR domain-containing protein n=1 Tax=Levilactobacillus fuyuanensis TaxID=2486022 RepID=A0ABW4H1U9_9LACO|nr:DGQHR domain-containing protein [Levilactobacillus fuyuanensis]
MKKTLYGILGRQRNRYIITGIMSIQDMLDVYDIDVWEPNKPIDEQGSQRKPIPAHYRKIGRQFKKDSFWLPTSITLSSSLQLDGDVIDLNETQDTVISDLDDSKEATVELMNLGKLKIPLVRVTLGDNYKLRVVDGQHRIKGIEYAIRDLKIKNLEDFELPYVIMLTKNRVDEIQSFYEINSTPKRVATDLALQLLKEMSENSVNSDLNATKRAQLVALNAAMVLNDDPNSVWFQSISVGQTKNSSTIASTTSFVTALKPLITGRGASKVILQQITGVSDENVSIKNSEKTEEVMGNDLAKFISNFWEALREIMPSAFPDRIDDKNKWVIQKTPGIFSLSSVAGKLFDLMYSKAQSKADFSVQGIRNFLEMYAGVGITSDIIDMKTYWQSSNKTNNIIGGVAANANSQKAFKQLANDIFDDIESNYTESNPKKIIL